MGTFLASLQVVENLQSVALPVSSLCRHQNLCHLGRERGTSTMKKTEKLEVWIARARKWKCSTSCLQAVTSPCICPPGNLTLGTGDTSGDCICPPGNPTLGT